MEKSRFNSDRDFSLLYCVTTGSVAHPAIYLMDAGGTGDVTCKVVTSIWIEV
jgi:hypothetical protein